MKTEQNLTSQNYTKHRNYLDHVRALNFTFGENIY